MTDEGEPATAVEQESPSSVPTHLDDVQLAERTAALHTAITEGMWTGCCAGCMDTFNHVKPWPCPSATWAAGALGEHDGDLEPADA